MSQAASINTIGGPPPLNLIDFHNHPDADLLRLCASLAKLGDAQDRLEDAIARTELCFVAHRRERWTAPG